MVSGDQPEPAQEPKSESRATTNRECNNKGVRRAAGGSKWQQRLGSREGGGRFLRERDIELESGVCVSMFVCRDVLYFSGNIARWRDKRLTIFGVTQISIEPCEPERLGYNLIFSFI
jgi:hypothetical protein